MEAAADSYSRVVVKAPQHLEARLSLATLLQQLGRPKEALKALESMYDSETLAQDSSAAQKASMRTMIYKNKNDSVNIAIQSINIKTTNNSLFMCCLYNIYLFVCLLGVEAVAASFYFAEDSGTNRGLPRFDDQYDLHVVKGKMQTLSFHTICPFNNI